MVFQVIRFRFICSNFPCKATQSGAEFVKFLPEETVTLILNSYSVDSCNESTQAFKCSILKVFQNLRIMDLCLFVYIGFGFNFWKYFHIENNKGLKLFVRVHVRGITPLLRGTQKFAKKRLTILQFILRFP